MTPRLLQVWLISAAGLALAACPTASRASNAADVVACDAVSAAAADDDAARAPAASVACGETATGEHACVAVRSPAAIRAASQHRRHRVMGAAANPQDTRVRLRHAHHHRHHAHPVVQSTIASESPASSVPLPLPSRPYRHPTRAHATIPHNTPKLHRFESRGGAYALGHARLSLGLEALRVTPLVSVNDLVTDPSMGWLKGRSPPRGDPSALIACACPRRASPSSRAPLPSAASSSLRTRALSGSGVRARPVSRAPLSVLTSERALEGGPVGPFTPSRRCLT